MVENDINRQELKGEQMVRSNEYDDFFIGLGEYERREIANSRRNEPDRSDYNIFLALNKNSDEVDMNFIYSLLDPNGYHYLGDEFLRKFLEVCDINDFDISNIQVNKEDGERGFGYMDICIRNRKQCIIINNKTNEKDQREQMHKYITYVHSKYNYYYKNIYFVYLSANRGSVSDKSMDMFSNISKVNIKHIYYSKEIIKWLKSCLKSKITDSLKFYINMYIDTINSIYDKHMYVKDEAGQKYIEQYYDRALEFYDRYKIHKNQNDSITKQRLRTIDISTSRIIDNFMDALSNDFKKLIGDDLIVVNNICRKYRKNGIWLEIYNEAWCDDKNPRDEKFILFTVFNRNNKLFIGIDVHKNIRRKGLKWQKIWSDINPKDKSDSEISLLLYKQLELDKSINLNTKEEFARTILNKKISVDRLSSDIRCFVDKYKDIVITINNNKEDKFWKAIEK